MINKNEQNISVPKWSKYIKRMNKISIYNIIED